MQPLGHAGYNLYPEIDAVARRLITSQLLFAPFFGDVKYRLETDKDTGERIAKVTKLPDTVVHVSPGFNKKNTDVVEIPLKMPFEGKPMYGDQYYKGTGEKVRVRWGKQFVAPIAHTILEKAGQMDDLRKEKLAQIYKDNMEGVTNHMAEIINAQYLSAIYEGHSENVTTGLDDAPNAIGASVIYHPNMYRWKTASTVESMAAVGTAKQNKTAAQITAAVETAYSELTAPSIKGLEEMCVVLEALKIPKAATYKGTKYWLVTVNRQMMNTLKTIEVFRKSLQDAFIGKEYQSPLFSQDAIIFDEIMFLRDSAVTRSWSSTYGFAGSNGWLGDPSANATYPNAVMNVLGIGALSNGNPMPYRAIRDGHNFGLNAELLSIALMGVSRGEYVAEDKQSTYYATKNTRRTVLSTNIDVINQTSAQFIFKV